MQIWLPMGILLQVFREVFGKQDMSGIAARHDPLRDINSSSGEIGLIVHISHGIDRAAVDAHTQLQAWMRPQFPADLERTFYWRFWIVGKDEDHPVSRWQTREFTFRFSSTELVR